MVSDFLGMPIHPTLAFIQLLLKLHGRTGGCHQLAAIIGTLHFNACRFDVYAALFHDHIARKHSDLFALVEHAIVGLYFNRL